MKRTLLSLMLLVASLASFAYDFEVDGIYYNVLSNDDLTCRVTYRDGNYNSYSGEVTIPSQVSYAGKVFNVTSIGEKAFYNCSLLTSVTIPNSVTKIGSYAFRSCSGLTSVTIPNNVTSIGMYAFYGCSGLTSVTIPNSVESIGSHAFYKCSSLASVTIPNSVTSIGLCAFQYCSSLTSVVIPNSVTSIEESAFSGCSLASIVVESGNSIYDSRNNCNAIIETASNTLVQGCKNTIIPNSVTSIGSGAFSDCSGLTSVAIPNSVTSIGSGAFSDCSGLTSVAIPNSVTSIGSTAFRDCSALTSVTIGNSVTSIGNYAFEGCSGLTSVTIPNSVTSIGSSAFSGCTNVKELIYADGCTTTLRTYLTNIESVTIPNSVTSIGSQAFNGCSGLTSITISCKDMNDFASYISREDIYKIFHADGLGEKKHDISINGVVQTEITIPNSVTSIGSSAFRDCSSLTSVTIPNSVTSIGSVAFDGCSGLTSVTIPNSVTSIGNYAFEGCSGLTTVTIPNSVTSIGTSAFSGCKLHTVISKSLNPGGYGDAFSSNSYTYAMLYVPEGSYWNYAYDCPWTFIHMKEMVNDANEVKQEVLYMLADAEGANYSVYDADNKEIRTIDYAHNLDEESLGTYWQIQKSGTNHYLYSPAANQYATMQNGKLQLSTAPVNINLSEQDGTLTIGGTKCMLVLNTELENTTAISTPTAMQNMGQRYDLQGRKLSSANKGIYIQDGKKVLMK